MKTLIRTWGVCFFALAGSFASTTPAFGDDIPWSILTEIERQANEPACRYENRINGTDYDCTNVDPDWVDCFAFFIADELTYNQALDLLGQLKVSNSYYEAYYAVEPNPYITRDYVDLLDEIGFYCEF